MLNRVIQKLSECFETRPEGIEPSTPDFGDLRSTC